jgi:serine protease
MILCAATGNDDAGPVIYPAAYSREFDAVIAVGSTDDDDTVSSFSNVGPEVTVVAPGGEILSTTPTYNVAPTVALHYDFFSGTSMATPLVSGLAALIWSASPSLTNTEVRQRLINTSDKLGPGDFAESWGHGRVDAAAALEGVQDGPTSPVDLQNDAALLAQLISLWPTLSAPARKAIRALIGLS